MTRHPLVLYTLHARFHYSLYSATHFFGSEVEILKHYIIVHMFMHANRSQKFQPETYTVGQLSAKFVDLISRQYSKHHVDMI